MKADLDARWSILDNAEKSFEDYGLLLNLFVVHFEYNLLLTVFSSSLSYLDLVRCYLPAL